MAAGALTIAIAAATAIGVSSLGARSVAPAGSTSSNGRGTTTILPDGRCFSGDVSLSIGTVVEHRAGTARWAVMARSRAETPCRPVAPIKATIVDSNGHIVTAVAGTRTAALLPTDAGFVSELVPDSPTIVAYLDWQNPCSNGPVELDVNGFSPTTARLKLARQPCASGPITTSNFRIEGAGPIAGASCPPGSVDLGITWDENVGGLNLFTARIGAFSHEKLLCRTHAGLDVTIETLDGRVLTEIPGNPARQGETYQDLLRPSVNQIIANITWTNPCTTTPVQIVVRFHDFGYGQPQRVKLPTQICRAGPVSASRLRISTGAVPR